MEIIAIIGLILLLILINVLGGYTGVIIFSLFIITIFLISINTQLGRILKKLK